MSCNWIAFFPAMARIIGVVVVGSGLNSTRQFPCLSACVRSCLPPSETCTISPGSAHPHIGIFASCCNTMPLPSTAGNATSPRAANAVTKINPTTAAKENKCFIRTLEHKPRPFASFVTANTLVLCRMIVLSLLFLCVGSYQTGPIGCCPSAQINPSYFPRLRFYPLSSGNLGTACRSCSLPWFRFTGALPARYALLRVSAGGDVGVGRIAGALDCTPARDRWCLYSATPWCPGTSCRWRRPCRFP